jgi:hypothetical protein
MGVKLGVWKQGQFYPEIGKTIVELPYQVELGPSDDQIRIEGFQVSSNSAGNFLEGQYTEDELDAIHTYGVARMVIDLYQLVLRISIHWSWWEEGKTDQLIFRINNSGINSRYLRDHRCIQLDCYGPYGNRIYNCRTVDLVAHETAHAILDSLKPNWSTGDLQTQGIVESLCDLSACFWILNQQELCNDVIYETEGNLRKDSMLSLFGVGHGSYNNPYKEIRNMLSKPTQSQAASSHYSYGQRLSYILFQTLIDRFEATRSSANDPAEILHITGKKWIASIINTIMLCNQDKTTIPEFLDIYSTEFQVKF